MMEIDSKIYVAGHSGLVGSAIVRKLQSKGYHNLIHKTHAELDLMVQSSVSKFFETEKPDYVFLTAAKVGGIQANSIYPADFYFVNSMIQNNVIHHSHLNKVKKLIFLGSSCIYPKSCPQPIKEEYLLSGSLEHTNEAYAIAKISGLKMCQYYKQQYGDNFISCMPTNLYGPNDNFNLETSHVLPALIRRFHEAKIQNLNQVEVWGTGEPLREFLHVDDLADACVFLMNHYDGLEHINIGSGEEISIKDLALLIMQKVRYNGEIFFNSNKPDGTFRKLLDVSKLNSLGWQKSIRIEEGIEAVYAWYKDTIGDSK